VPLELSGSLLVSPASSASISSLSEPRSSPATSLTLRLNLLLDYGNVVAGIPNHTTTVVRDLDFYVRF
jgi:hypothetical protein